MYSSRFYHKELKTAILTALKDSLPKELKASDYTLNMQCEQNPPTNTTRTNLFRRGYNQAIQDIINIIEEK